MKKASLLTILSFVLTVLLSASGAFAQNFAEQIANDHDFYVDTDKGAVSKPLIGDKEEDGVLEFFVQKQPSVQFDNEVVPEDLNNIAPAAGIQLRFEL